MSLNDENNTSLTEMKASFIIIMMKATNPTFPI